jgi:acetolactate synthase small subunit
MDRLVLLRLHDRPGALERVLGAIRRKVLAVRRLSLHAPADGLHEVVIRFDPGGTPEERIMAELGSLYDVHDIRTLPADPDMPTREMALAHVRTGRDPDVVGRVVGRGPEGVVVEVTGTPAEIDDALDRLRASGDLTAAVRTGEVVVPTGGTTSTAGTGRQPDIDQSTSGPDAAPNQPGEQDV